MKTIIEYSLKATSHPELERKKIRSSNDAELVLRSFFYDDIIIYESFFILMLNRTNTVTGWAKISQGGVVGTVVDPKIIAKYIADTMASGIILCHNHPSGNKTPSQSDIDITKKINSMVKYFDCKVFDHIILTETDYYSFADNGDL